MDRLCDFLQGIGKIAASSRGRQGLAFLVVEHNGLVEDSAKLGENLLFVQAMATPIQQARRAPYKALIFLRPLRNFGVKCAFIHLSASWTAFSTARIWYFLASSPSLPEIVTGFGTFG